MLPEYSERIRRAFAQNILRNSLRIQRGENLLVETWSGTLPWAESLVLEARVMGARPLLVLEDETTFWQGSTDAPAAHVAQVGTHEWAILKFCHAQVQLTGPYDTAREQGLPDSVRRRIAANDHEWFRLTAQAGIRTIRWDLGRTNEFWARRYGVELDQWRKELIEAATLDPRPMRRDGIRIARALRRGHSIRITHPNGTDLRLRLVGRLPKVDDGIIDDQDVREGNLVESVPSGVTGVTVDETYAEGTFVGGNAAGVAFVSHFRDQIPLQGGCWHFKRGRLVDYSFQKGEDEFRRAFRSLGSGKDRPGLISVGLNPSTTSIPLQFDQEKGVVCLTVGHNHHHHGGRTRTPHFVAYQSIRGATLEVDGTRVVHEGRITTPSRARRPRAT
jgi:aminopeptidase